MKGLVLRLINYAAHRTFSNQLTSARIAESRDLKLFYKHIRSELLGPVGSLQTRDNSGNIVDNNHTGANVFADTFSRVFTKEPSDVMPIITGASNTFSLCNTDFSKSVVCEKLKKLRMSKSPGPDLINS